MQQNDIYSIDVMDIRGHAQTLEKYKGSVLLVVNVASKCGLTKQYKELQEIYDQYKKMGLVVLGFPSNDFRGQEPGTNEEILEFCSLKYDVTFPLFGKIVVGGQHQHPLYRYLTSTCPTAQKNETSDFEARLAEFGHKKESPHDILWNFEKFVIGRDGKIVGRFTPDTTPDDKLIVSTIESALGYS